MSAGGGQSGPAVPAECTAHYGTFVGIPHRNPSGAGCRCGEGQSWAAQATKPAQAAGEKASWGPVGDDHAVLVVDETGDEKSSTDAVGAARQ